MVLDDHARRLCARLARLIKTGVHEKPRSFWSDFCGGKALFFVTLGVYGCLATHKV
jgi:hypothetical protein